MRRYSILVMQHGSKHETELCQVDNDPHAIARAAAEKRLRISAGDRMFYIPKYDSVRVIDNQPAE
jgi:hypothetical protein